jgi:hypothetical protein
MSQIATSDHATHYNTLVTSLGVYWNVGAEALASVPIGCVTVSVENPPLTGVHGASNEVCTTWCVPDSIWKTMMAAGSVAITILFGRGDHNQPCNVAARLREG